MFYYYCFVMLIVLSAAAADAVFADVCALLFNIKGEYLLSNFDGIFSLILESCSLN